MGLRQYFQENQIVLVIFSESDSAGQLITLLQEIRKITEKIGYISISKPYSKIVEIMNKSRLKRDEAFIVDSASVSMGLELNAANCSFVSSPDALTELRVAFVSMIREKNRQIVIFDSLSDLLRYNDISKIVKFTNNIIMKSRIERKNIVFLSDNDASDDLIKDFHMFVDRVIIMD